MISNSSTVVITPRTKTANDESVEAEIQLLKSEIEVMLRTVEEVPQPTRVRYESCVIKNVYFKAQETSQRKIILL